MPKPIFITIPVVDGYEPNAVARVNALEIVSVRPSSNEPDQSIIDMRDGDIFICRKPYAFIQDLVDRAVLK
jgi:hypothetical protein